MGEKDAVYDFVGRAQSLSTVADLNLHFRKLIERWGFDGWGCIQVSSAPSAIKAPLLRMFGEINKDWVERYLGAGHINFDTAAHEVMRRNDPFWWTEIADPRKITRRQKLVYDEATDFGLNKGLAIPVRFPDGSIWSVMLYGRNVEEVPHLKEMAFLAAQYYAGRGMYLGDRAQTPVTLASRLTDRQREIVEMLRFGSSQLQIAKRLGLSESTINNQVDEAKDRLGAKTPAELVAEALLTGEIGGAERRLESFAD